MGVTGGGYRDGWRWLEVGGGEWRWEEMGVVWWRWLEKVREVGGRRGSRWVV